MANYKNKHKEELLDNVERLYIMGFRKPYQVMKLADIEHLDTVKKYILIAKRRISRRNRKRNPDVLIKEQLDLYDQAIAEVWKTYLEVGTGNEKTGCLNSLQKILKNKAELLGLEEPKRIKLSDDDKTPLSDLFNKMNPDEREKAITIFEQLLSQRDEKDSLPETPDNIYSTGGIQNGQESNSGKLEDGNTA